MKLLRNIWYMAGWAEELAGKPFHRKIAGEHVVLYRQSSGALAAIGDTCPHRFAPLHLGQQIEDTIECPYHGLRFNAAGACVHNPHSDGPPPKAVRVPAYPVVERDGIVWLWIGDAAKADESLIKDYSVLNDEANFTYTAGGVLHMNTAYDLILDNLMDLSHAAFLHMNNLGNEAIGRRGITSVKTVGDTIISYRMGPNGLPAPMHVGTRACGPQDMVDFWADMSWSAPANLYLETGVVLTGRARTDNPKIMNSVQILTPESENSTHYFIKLYRNYERDDAEMTEIILSTVIAAFKSEDEWMVSEVAQRMEGHEFWSLKPLLLPSDTGAVLVRRALEKLVNAQESAVSAAA